MNKMMGEPWFWRDESLAAKAVSAALTPLAWAYQLAAEARKVIATPWRASIPVICIGNASVGGVGKTPFALMLGEALQKEGFTPHFLSRGFGGELKGPVNVDANKHSARDVGDEPLLLARQAPAWVSRNKRAGARAAIAAGADVIVLDDGFQNPTIAKDVAILLSDSRMGYGNGKIFPAGPMRESLEGAKARADIIVEVKPSADAPGRDETADYAAWLESVSETGPERVLAFCGIANPERFFETLERAGFDIADAIAFPDHYAYSEKNIDILQAQAKKLGAALITTEKDFVRINAKQRDGIQTLPVRMRISDSQALTAFVVSAIKKKRAR